MDYQRNSEPRDRRGIPLIYGLSLPSIEVSLTLQDGCSKGKQPTDPKGELIHILPTRLDDVHKLFETTFTQNQDLTW